MSKINEATDTDLKVIDVLQKIGWKRGDTLLYQQEYKLLPEQQILFGVSQLHFLHGDTIQVIDNIPIDEARNIFEKEIQNTPVTESNQMKEKAKADGNYEPTENEIDTLNTWSHNPEVFLDEGQLRKIMVLRKIKGFVSANIADKRRMSPQEIFDNPFYVRAIGRDYQEVNQLFDNRFPRIFKKLQTTFKI